MLRPLTGRDWFHGAVADSEYPYPPDQFDREAEEATFHGAHRAEEPFWRQNLVYLIIIAAAVLTLLVLLFVIGGQGRGGSGDDAATQGASSSAASAPASDGGSEQPAAPQADQATPVLVVNASGKSGLAGQWRDKLTGQGWSRVDIQTAKNRQQEAVVYYKDEADAASAQALAQAVGVPEAQQSDDYDARITFLAVDAPQG